jgi:hypothetical protein
MEVWVSAQHQHPSKLEHRDHVRSAVDMNILDFFRTLRHSSEPLSQRDAETFLALFGRKSLARYFRNLAADGSEVVDIAKRSSIHANGFTKLVLERRENSALRLHIWKESDGGSHCSAENVHNHVWEFSSRVLIGTLTDERFSKTANGEMASEYEYVRDNRRHTTRGILKYLNETRLSCTREISHRAGEIYSMGTTVLHRARGFSDQSLGVTLAWTRFIKAQRARVYSIGDSPVLADPPSNHVTPDETVSILRAVADAI